MIIDEINTFLAEHASNHEGLIDNPKTIAIISSFEKESEKLIKSMQHGYYDPTTVNHIKVINKILESIISQYEDSINSNPSYKGSLNAVKAMPSDHLHKIFDEPDEEAAIDDKEEYIDAI